MQMIEIISLIIAIVSVLTISIVFTVLFQYYVRSQVKRIESGEADIELIDETLEQRTEAFKHKKKVMSAVKITIFVILLVLIVPLFVFSLISRISGGRPVLGRSFMVVASPSMSKKNADNEYLFENELNEQFDKYDMIVLNSVGSADELKLYDIVAYRNDKGVNVIHRIVAITGEGEDIKYSMRGDANNANDTYHPVFSDIIGVYRGTNLKLIGAVVLFMQSYSGILTVIALLYCLFMADHLIKKLNKSKTDRNDMLVDAMFGDSTDIKEINYQGFVYRFDENGFADKTETEPNEEGLMIKLNGDGSEQKIKIEKRKNDGKDQ